MNAQGGQFGNALQATADRGDLGMVQLLLSRNVDVTIQPWIDSRASLLHACAISDNYDLVKLLMDTHPGIHWHLETQDISGLTPLHIAVEQGNYRIAKCFLDKGASPDTPDLGDITPFRLAVQHQHAAMALLLLQKSQWGLSRMSASDWRRCLVFGRNCNLELICGKPPRLLVRDDDIKSELEKMSYPLSNSIKLAARETDFITREEYEKRLLYVSRFLSCPRIANERKAFLQMTRFYQIYLRSAFTAAGGGKLLRRTHRAPGMSICQRIRCGLSRPPQSQASTRSSELRQIRVSGILPKGVSIFQTQK